MFHNTVQRLYFVGLNFREYLAVLKEFVEKFYRCMLPMSVTVQGLKF